MQQKDEIPSNIQRANIQRVTSRPEIGNVGTADSELLNPEWDESIERITGEYKIKTPQEIVELVRRVEAAEILKAKLDSVVKDRSAVPGVHERQVLKEIRRSENPEAELKEVA